MMHMSMERYIARADVWRLLWPSFFNDPDGFLRRKFQDHLFQKFKVRPSSKSRTWGLLARGRLSVLISSSPMLCQWACVPVHGSESSCQRPCASESESTAGMRSVASPSMLRPRASDGTASEHTMFY